MNDIPVFQERIKPKRAFFGIPDAVLMPHGVAGVFLGYLAYLSLSAGAWAVAAVMGLLSVVFGGVALSRWYKGVALLLEPLSQEGRTVFKRKTYSPKYPAFFSAFCWRYPRNQYVMQHHDGALSVLFSWQGRYNEFDDATVWERAAANYDKIIKQLANDTVPITLEWHWERRPDDSAVDAYERVGAQMNTPNTPRIVTDIRAQMAHKLRGQGFSNRVYGVLSIHPKPPFTLKNLIQKKTTGSAVRQHKHAIHDLIRAAEVIKNSVPGFCLETVDRYYAYASRAVSPHNIPQKYHAGMDFSEQVAYEKPQWDEAHQCLKKGDTYLKPVLLFRYPTLTAGFFLSLSSLKTQVHVSQIIQPKPASQAIRKVRRENDNKKVFSSEDQHNWDEAKHEMSDAEGYCEFVQQTGTAVADNAYIVVFSATADTLGQMHTAFERWSTLVSQNDGELRYERDIQYALYLYQAPGMGRYSRFMREDTGQVIGCLLPDTIYDAGDPEPEILRQCRNGQLFGYSPSKDIVLGQLVAGQTGGGKDSQFGLSLLETYQVINYTIFEEGNSYQAIVEALGGRYCEAVHQIINPLASYSDYQSACQRDHGSDNVISGLRTVLLPIFKGFSPSAEFSVEEKVVVDAALSALYQNPMTDQEAPILPNLETVLSESAVVEADYTPARESLHKSLKAFLKTSDGKPFTHEDQFVLSPVINAINFEGLSGTLLKYYLGFMAERVSMKAFASGKRSQIVINEYRTLLDKAPEALRWVTLLLDRKGRKEWTGLTRITQGIDEVLAVDPESLSSMGSKSLLSRKDEHERLGQLLNMPESARVLWSLFESPKIMNHKGYREMLLNTETEHSQWHYLKLEFPELLLDLMTTAGADKTLRRDAMQRSQDVYERIALIKAGREEQKKQKKQKKQDTKKEHQEELTCV